MRRRANPTPAGPGDSHTNIRKPQHLECATTREIISNANMIPSAIRAATRSAMGLPKPTAGAAGRGGVACRGICVTSGAAIFKQRPSAHMAEPGLLDERRAAAAVFGSLAFRHKAPVAGVSSVCRRLTEGGNPDMRAIVFRLDRDDALVPAVLELHVDFMPVFRHQPVGQLLRGRSPPPAARNRR